MQEANFANNSLEVLPDSWIAMWGTVNSTGRLALPSSNSDSPVITVLGNPLKKIVITEIDMNVDI